jgi:hypothetical protein
MPLDWGVRPKAGPHEPLSEAECRELVEAQGRKLVLVTDHQIHSIDEDGKHWVQWRPDPRFPPSPAVRW